MKADMKKLMRAALEPARVFCRADFTDHRGPVYVYEHNGVTWYSPEFPTWLIRGGDCKVLARAVERYGTKDAPVIIDRFRDFGDSLFNSDGEPVKLVGEAEIFALADDSLFPGYRLDGDTLTVVPATPVLYCIRRFGEGVEWRLHRQRSILRGFVEGDPVIAIALVQRAYEVPDEQAA